MPDPSLSVPSPSFQLANKDFAHTVITIMIDLEKITH
jgi:hypothetical protein